MIQTITSMFTHGGFCGTKHNVMAIKRQHWTTTNTNEVNVDTPTYYDGKKNYTAIDVVTNFDLNYNLGTACTYILRAYKKHETPNEDIQKAIDHLKFELNKLNNK